MKKEIIILLLAITGLGLYLGLQSRDKDDLALPRLEKLQLTQIDRLQIGKKGAEIELVKKDDHWLIQPQGYAADEVKVKNMLNAASDLTVTALVSESGSVDRYDLSEADRIAVQVFAGEKPARAFNIGRAAPTHQHTFIKLDGDDRIYHARGTLDNTFGVTREDLRDKNVLTFEEQSITTMEIRKGERTVVLAKVEIPEVPPAQEPAKENAPAQTEPGQAKAAKTEWRDAEGKPVDQTAVERLLGPLSNLQCDGFLEDRTKTDTTSPGWSLVLKNGEKRYTLAVYVKDQDRFAATSSGSQDVFFLEAHRIETMEKHLAALLGEEATEKTEK